MGNKMKSKKVYNDNIWACEEKYLVEHMNLVLNSHVDEKAIVDLESLLEDQNILSIDDETAYITISGILTKSGPTIIEKFLGLEGTAYTSIIDALNQADANSKVKKVVLLMSTPGGSVLGADETADAVKKVAKNKTVYAVNEGMIASAGYWIASQANKILSTSPANMSGSIGVIITAMSYDPSEENPGLIEVTVVSRNAPKKAPDLKTQEAIDVLQDRADALERVMISKVAKGRGKTTKFVAENFGKGDLLIAKDPDKQKPDAISAGMIDAIVESKYTLSKFSDTDMFALQDSYVESSPAFKDLALADIDWNADASRRRIRAHTGSNDKPSSTYKDAFFWHDSKAPEKFESYKLPFADIVEGKMIAVVDAISAIDLETIPKEDRGAVSRHLEKYYSKSKKQNSKKESNKMSKSNEEGLTVEDIKQMNSKAVTTIEADAKEKERKRLQKIEALIEEVKDAPDCVKAAAQKVIDENKFEDGATAENLSIKVLRAATEAQTVLYKKTAEGAEELAKKIGEVKADPANKKDSEAEKGSQDADEETVKGLASGIKTA